ncbi:MAG: hypothetical protein JNK36_10960 [Bacteroidia bacterium]|nr:hypothetical protein [Bacteroidia bacterium]MBP7713802.1 hypothetical protein [Bacteroidia bacterium]MBP8668382.1 hypothetical protein [Bacteroidia bacterium]HOZ82927.1 hypothetical protein [Bacteroidia bacterium]HQW17856.1 hypothetical protein [Bacteroidia bacterium]
MRQVFTVLFLAFTGILHGQNKIEWDGKYQLQLSDFQSPASQIGEIDSYSLLTGSGMEFSFYMNNAEFMFTKNFNSKVNCSFNRNAASLVAPDSLIALDLLSFARYDFDLSELYARKFRKSLFEEKGAFSDISFFQPIYDKIQQELSERRTIAGKATEIGRNTEKLIELHREVNKEIEQLDQFCKTCKPSKKKSK